MCKVFFDANIINDIYDSKRALAKDSYLCLKQCLEYGYDIVTSCDIVTNVYYITAKYTDKSSYAPENYITSFIYDFTIPLKSIYDSVQAGDLGGYYKLGFDTGAFIQTPLQNVDPSVATEVEAIIADVVSGKIDMVKDSSEIK